MKTLFTLFAVLALTACATTTTTTDSAPAEAEAAPAEAAEATPEIPVYDWAQVTEAMGSGAILVDARGAQSYANGHIENAINIPCRGADETYSVLPADRNTQVVFYCGGPACSASNKGATAAARLGYTNVAEYKGGYPEWKSQQPAAAE